MTGDTERAGDVAWKKYFDEVDVLGEIALKGYASVNADRLKKIAQREPRLLAKQDTLSSRPQVFTENSLSIYPTRNGEYIIFRDNENRAYFSLGTKDYPTQLELYKPRVDLRSFDSFPGLQKLNESQALDFAFVSSLLASFTGDSGLNLLIRGRIYSGRFQFTLPEAEKTISVENVQIEVDGGYESRDSILLVEAKVGRRKDFNIRQLYYPFLEWSSRSRKRIIPVFLVVTNGLFYFFEIGFGARFGDISIKRAKCYSIDESPVTMVELTTELSHVKVEAEPSDIPFPQANDLDKVVDLVSMLESSPSSGVEIAEHFEFDRRQGDYYGNAAAYLGFAARSGSRFTITGQALGFISKDQRADRSRTLIQQLLRRPVFREVLSALFAKNFDVNEITQGEVEAAIRRHTFLTGSTPGRRSSTVRSWLEWIGRNVTIVE